MAISLVTAYSRGPSGDCDLTLSNLAAGDLIAVLTTADKNTEVNVYFNPSPILLRGYLWSSMGYMSKYRAQTRVYSVSQPGTYSLAMRGSYAGGLLKRFAYLVCVYRSDEASLWTPQDATSRNSLQPGQTLTVAVPEGILLCTAANETWGYEWTWDHTTTGNVVVDRHDRCHDAFFTAGRTTQGTVSFKLTKYMTADFFVIPVRYDPLYIVQSSFFMV